MKSSPYKKNGGTRSGAGKPAYQPTESDRATVVVMSACGKDQHQIGACIGEGLSDATIRKHFKHELAIAKDKLDGICMTGLAKLMQEGNLGALIFYAKTRLGWRETTDHRLTGELALKHRGAIETDSRQMRTALEMALKDEPEEVRHRVARALFSLEPGGSDGQLQ